MQVDCSNVLICFQNVVVDNTNCRPPNCHHNLLLMQLWLWEVFWRHSTIKPLTRLFTIIIKNPLFVTRENSVKKGTIGFMYTKHWADFKSPKLLMRIELMMNIFIEFFFTFPMFCKWRETVAVLNHLCTVRSHVDPCAHAQLILVEVSDALCSSLNSTK